MCVPAEATDEAVRMVGASQSRHHLPGDVAGAAVTPGAVETLVVLSTDVLPPLLEEPGTCQVTSTHWGRDGRDGGQKEYLEEL